ncbi:PD40 domain-containing protein [Candidatus Desantisbacteria bacterium]|nr:PD40 domain-containing protein [Candidatus Desantisbacteria bacterium]
MKNKIKIFGIIGFTLICASILTAYFTIYYVPVLRIEDILSAYDKEPKCTGLSIIYPLDETIFPPEIISPKFIWKDENIKSDTWLITIKFHDNKELLTFITQTSVWEPTDDMWKQIKDNSVERKAIVTIIGVSRKSPKKILSSAGISIMTSKDEVGAPIFFREVNLPFKLAVTDPAKYIKWRFGPISSKTPPPIVLENLIVCGNCHSFSRDGKILAMEVDAGNDKGSYATAPIEKEIILDKSRIFTWSAFEQIKDEMTFGLLCQVSPDGKYVAGTVKDRALAIYRNDIMFSQLFFLIKGFVAIYDREKKTIKSLPGADDRTYVQTNATWSPDSKSIVFARSRDKAFE